MLYSGGGTMRRVAVIQFDPILADTRSNLETIAGHIAAEDLLRDTRLTEAG